MKQKILLILLGLLTCVQMPAQKWFKKARKAQVNVLTYDAQGQLLRSSNAFVVTDDGTALSDYATFKGAARAVAIDDGGKQYEVDYVCGASSLYDVVRFHIAGLKATPVKLATVASIKGQTAHIMPYLGNKANSCTPATISDVSRFNDHYTYYTLDTAATEKSASCPVLNDEGEVIGLLQMAATNSDKQCFVLDASFPMSLTTTAISATSSDYRDIHIRKALPTDASQANSFIYLTGTQDTVLYQAYIDDFIRLFPTEPAGYVMKGELLASMTDYAGAEQAWAAGLKATKATDELHYSMARSIYAQTQAHTDLPEGWTLAHALEEAEQAFATNPLPTYTALQGHILYSQKNYEAACQKFQEVCRTNLRSASHFLYAAQCKQMLSDTLGVLALQDSAVACFSKPYVEEAATPLLMRANTLIALKSYREAVADLNEYEHLKAASVNANFYDQRAQAELQCRMFQQALNDYERACQLEPNEPLYPAQLAALHYRVGQVDECISAARKAIALDAEFADAYRILGVALRHQGKQSEARQQLQKAAELGDTIARDLLAE
ncbi:MAG: serine protease [Bacteroidaceae bacterium]|nr:serine protease [Bacteroidaceae bacterium]